jgi:hypothetical protein
MTTPTKVLLAGGALAVLVVGLYWRPSSPPVPDSAGVPTPSHDGEPSAARNAEVAAKPTTSASATTAPTQNPAPPPIVATAAPAKSAPAAATPEMARLAQQLAQDRRKVQRAYGPVFDQLHLPPDQQEKLTQLLVNYREASIDYVSATATTGVDPTQDRETSQLSIASLRDGIQQQIKALLGDERYAAFQVAEQAARQEGVINRVQNNLQASGQLLTAEQQTQLNEVLRSLDLNHVTPDVIDRAASFLTPAQLAALQKIQQERARGLTKPPFQNAIRENLPPTPAGKGP